MFYKFTSLPANRMYHGAVLSFSALRMLTLHYAVCVCHCELVLIIRHNISCQFMPVSVPIKFEFDGNMMHIRVVFSLNFEGHGHWL